MTKVKNSEEVDAWIEQQLQDSATYLGSVKGVVPGATYSDGTPRTGPLPVGWRNPRTGEEIRYEFDVGVRQPIPTPSAGSESAAAENSSNVRRRLT